MHIRESESDNVIDLYLQGRLDEKVLEEFEVRMLEDPLLFNRVQQMKGMHAAFKQQESLFAQTLKGHQFAQVLPFALWVKQPMSLAASLLIAIGLAFTGSNYLQQVDELNSRAGYAVNSVINLGHTRSSTSEIVLTSAVHLLQIDVGVGIEQTAFLLSLLPERDGANLEFRVMPDSNGIVRLLTPSGLSGPYQLRVKSESGLARAASYQLRFE